MTKKVTKTKKISRGKKSQTSYEKFMYSLTPAEKKQFEQEHKDFLISEMLLAAMEKDMISVRKLAQLADVSPTIIQGIRSGTRSNVTVKTFSKILKILGYSLVMVKDNNRTPIDRFR